MKRKTTVWFALLTLICLAGSCRMQGVERTKEKITQNFPVSKFHSIHSSVVGNIEFTQEAQTSVDIQADSQTLKDIQVKVKDETLYLEYKEKKSKKRNDQTDQAIIKISSPQLKSLDIRGVGNVDIKGKLQTDNLQINSFSVGNLVMPDLRCRKLEVKSSAVGNIRLGGQADQVAFYSNAVGNIYAYDLKAKELDVQSSAVGNVECYASQKIVIYSNGVGNVKYKGSPAQKEIHRHGMGKVKSVK